MIKAAKYYTYINDLLEGRQSDDVLDESPARPDWPEELSDKLRLLMTDFIRTKHAERCKEFFDDLSQKDDDFFNGVIDKRLYALVATISSLHTKDFREIFAILPYQEIAFGDEHIHPQFVAAMLRIGDLLDMDNNRFNVRILEHVGDLPQLSSIHLKKHKALAHFNVTPTAILAIAKTDEFDVAKIVRDWFNWIEAETKDLKNSWNLLAPKALRECMLQECKLEVYLNGNLFSSRNAESFCFDNRKMHKLLIGDSIYSCRLDCLREYIQNALDASKVRMWGVLKGENVDYLYRKGKRAYPIQGLLPCDLKEEVFMRFPIYVSVSLLAAPNPDEHDRIRISIRDSGIGMDSSCVHDITTIGRGWRNRKEYQDVFRNAPKWLRPTGGFGIGLQSAFMLTDQVTFSTRSENELLGHKVNLVSPSRGGNVSVESKANMAIGTEVCFEIDANSFLNPEMLGIPERVLQRAKSYILQGEAVESIFSNVNIYNIAKAICKAYIEDQIPNSLLPIYFSGEEEAPILLPSPDYYQVEKSANGLVGKTPLQMYPFTELNTAKLFCTEDDSQYAYYIIPNTQLFEYDGRGLKIIIWDRAEVTCTSFAFVENAHAGIAAYPSMIVFKDVLVSIENRIPYVVYKYNILGRNAEKTLKVSRSMLSNEYEEYYRKALDKQLKVALRLLISHYEEILSKNPEQDLPKIFQSVVFAFLARYYAHDDFIRILEAIAGNGFLAGLKSKRQLTDAAISAFREVILANQKKECASLLFCTGTLTLKEMTMDLLTRSRKENLTSGVETPAVTQVSIEEKSNSGEKSATDDDYIGSECVPDQVSTDEPGASVCILTKAVVEEINELTSMLIKLSENVEQETYSREEEIAQQRDDIAEKIIAMQNEKKIHIFDSEWNECFSAMQDDNGMPLRRVVLKVKDEKYMDITVFYADATIDSPNRVDKSNMNPSGESLTKICEDKGEIREKYPELCIKDIPFPFSMEYGKMKHAYISLGKDFLSELRSLKESKTGVTREAIAKHLEEDVTFHRIVKWVWEHQCGNDVSLYTLQQVKEGYYRWIIKHIDDELVKNA